MSTATFSSSAHQHAGLSFARHGHSGHSPSSAAADKALRRMIDGRRLRNRAERTPHSHESAIAGALGSLTTSIAGSADVGALARQACKGIVLGAMAIILATATTKIISGQSLAGVAGTVTVGDAPLAHGILEFHLKDAAGSTASFQTVLHTDASGAFRRSAIGGLPRGTYAVVVKTRRYATSRAKHPAVVIPDRYAAAASTPLSVEVTGASAQFDLVVRQ